MQPCVQAWRQPYPTLGLLSGGALTLAGRHLILYCFLQHFVHGASFFIVIYSTLESRVSFLLFFTILQRPGCIFVVFYNGFVGIWHRGITFCCYLQWSEPHGNDFVIIYSTLSHSVVLNEFWSKPKQQETHASWSSLIGRKRLTGQNKTNFWNLWSALIFPTFT